MFVNLLALASVASRLIHKSVRIICWDLNQSVQRTTPGISFVDVSMRLLENSSSITRTRQFRGGFAGSAYVTAFGGAANDGVRAVFSASSDTINPSGFFAQRIGLEDGGKFTTGYCNYSRARDFK